MPNRIQASMTRADVDRRKAEKREAKAAKMAAKVAARKASGFMQTVSQKQNQMHETAVSGDRPA